jgi:hypothetical protein
MTMRLEKKWSVGDRGAEYEFRVKLSMRVRGVKISDNELGMETEQAVELFADELRNDYPWVGRVGLTGRSGGWLLVEDARGQATEDELSDINARVDQARKDFETALIESFGYEENGHRRNAGAATASFPSWFGRMQTPGYREELSNAISHAGYAGRDPLYVIRELTERLKLHTGPSGTTKLHARNGNRLYHVVVVNDRTGRKAYMTRTPVTHDEGTIILRKMRPHKDTRSMLEEA